MEGPVKYIYYNNICRIKKQEDCCIVVRGKGRCPFVSLTQVFWKSEGQVKICMHQGFPQRVIQTILTYSKYFVSVHCLCVMSEKRYRICYVLEQSKAWSIQ